MFCKIKSKTRTKKKEICNLIRARIKEIKNRELLSGNSLYMYFTFSYSTRSILIRRKTKKKREIEFNIVTESAAGISNGLKARRNEGKNMK